MDLFLQFSVQIAPPRLASYAWMVILWAIRSNADMTHTSAAILSTHVI